MSLCRDPQIIQLDHMVALFSTFQKNLRTGSPVTQLVYSLTSSVYGPFPLLIPSTCHCFSGDSHSERGEMGSQTVLICISLMTKDIEHIFHIFIGCYWPFNALIGWLGI